MADYTSVTIQYNTNTDASPTWTGTAIAFGGSSGANEFRWQRTGGGGGATTGSAAWPNIIKPGSNAAVEEMWAFSADTTGLKIATYDGGRTYANVLRFNFDNTGSPASAMQLGGFQDSTNTTTTPTAGSQTANATDGRNIINGSADTSNTSYLKANVYGSGFPSAGSQETPAAGNVGTTLAATSGTAGPASPSAAAWMATWQSLQGWIQYITAPSAFKVLTAGYWYFTCALFCGPNEQTGNMVFSPFVLQYTYT